MKYGIYGAVFVMQCDWILPNSWPFQESLTIHLYKVCPNFTTAAHLATASTSRSAESVAIKTLITIITVVIIIRPYRSFSKWPLVIGRVVSVGLSVCLLVTTMNL